MVVEELSIENFLMEKLKSIIKTNELNCWVLIRGIDTFKLCDLEYLTKSPMEHYTTKEFPLSIDGLFDAIREIDIEIAFHRGIAYCVKEELKVCANCGSFVGCSVERSESCRQATGVKSDKTYWTSVSK